MKIFIINLDRSTDRLDFQKKQLARLGLPFERFRASGSSDINTAHYHKRVARFEIHPLSLEQLGCFESHYRLWKIIAAMDGPALVLEDDAVLCDEMPELLNYIEKNLHPELQNAFIDLNIFYKKMFLHISKKSIPLVKNYKAMRFYNYHPKGRAFNWGSTGQIIYPQTAKHFLKKAEKYVGLADKFYNVFAKELWIIEPIPVAYKTELESVIAGNNKLNFYKETMFQRQTYFDRFRYARNLLKLKIDIKIIRRIKKWFNGKKIVKKRIKLN